MSAAVAATAGSSPAEASTSGRDSSRTARTVNLLVIGNPEAPELQALKAKLPAGAVLLGIGELSVVRQ